MPNILLIEPLPLMRQGISQILLEGGKDWQVHEIDYPASSHPLLAINNVALAVLSGSAAADWPTAADWTMRHFDPAAILMLADEHIPPQNLSGLPSNATCISNTVTPEILKAYVDLILAGGTDSVRQGGVNP